MLFFKDLYNEKMKDPDFASFFDRECHICEVVISLVARLEADGDKKEAVLAEIGLTADQYTQLKKGDRCDPQMVFPLCRALGLDTSGKEKVCPRLHRKGGR